jgi:transposase
LFDDRFGRPARGNDKSNVEGMVRYTRRNFMVPAPRYDSFDDLNTHLEQKCLERQSDTLRGHTQTIGARLIADLDALMGLPPLGTLLCNALPGSGRRI